MIPAVLDPPTLEIPMAHREELQPGLIGFWMLNDSSTVDEKIDYLRRCHAGGIKALCMHCRGGNLVPYGSEDWFQMIRERVKEGAKLEMDMWLYDEDPFPSGAAGGVVMAERPDLRSQRMRLLEPPADISFRDPWQISEGPVFGRDSCRKKAALRPGTLPTGSASCAPTGSPDPGTAGITTRKPLFIPVPGGRPCGRCMR